MVEALRPETIICYSDTPEDIYGAYRKQGIRLVSIENHTRAAARQAAEKAVE